MFSGKLLKELWRSVTAWMGLTKRCRLSWLTNTALVYEPKCGGRGGVAGSQSMSTAVQRSPINFGDITPYLTNASCSSGNDVTFLIKKKQKVH
jgi:hypothetical protein